MNGEHHLTSTYLSFHSHVPFSASFWTKANNVGSFGSTPFHCIHSDSSVMRGAFMLKEWNKELKWIFRNENEMNYSKLLIVCVCMGENQIDISRQSDLCRSMTLCSPPLLALELRCLTVLVLFFGSLWNHFKAITTSHTVVLLDI